jgi:hypothetical protein
MGSAASSDYAQGDLRLPPLSALPRDVRVDSLPSLGTTWVDRGAAYWVRRVWLALVFAVVVILITLIVVGLLGFIRSKSQAGFYAVLAVEVAWSLVLLGWLTVRAVRRWNNPAPPQGLVGRSRSAGAGGAAPGILARLGFVIGQAFLVMSVLFLGFYVALLISVLLPETPAEHVARLRLRQTLRARGYTAPGR